MLRFSASAEACFVFPAWPWSLSALILEHLINRASVSSSTYSTLAAYFLNLWSIHIHLTYDLVERILYFTQITEAFNAKDWFQIKLKNI